MLLKLLKLQEKRKRVSLLQMSSKKLLESLSNKVYFIISFTDIVSPLSICKDNAQALQVILDSQLVSSNDLLAFHPSDASKTVFINSTQLRDYLKSTGVKTTEVDFTNTPLGG